MAIDLLMSGKLCSQPLPMANAVLTTWCKQEALADSARKLLTDVVSNVSQKQAEPDYLPAGEKSELCIRLINAAVRCEGWVRAAIVILASCSFHRPHFFSNTMQQC